tara:strand:- start:7491 stop:9029 length:1539 start_codon:yes stop_codon:yes gene_type:complete
MEEEVGTVAKRYSQLESERDTFLERGREAAKLTIPTLMPEEGHSSSSIYATPYQGIGARGVNNLASKLLLALLPPNSPFFRLIIDDFDLQEIAGENRGQVEEGLARIERAAMSEIESKAIRVPTFEALKLLIVTGNALVYLPKEGGMKVFRPDRYVVKRDTMGNLLEVITKESLDALMLPDSIKEVIPPSDSPQKNYDLYTYVKKSDKGFIVHQEVKGIEVPESRGVFKKDSNPFIPLRFIRIDGEDYGRGFIEEYLGDLRSLEALTQAIVQGSAASAKVLFLVRPNGTTKSVNLAKAPNGAFLSGDANDVSTLQVQKASDFRVALETMRMINDRLSAAFLLNSSVQRSAERVTAEEIRFMAQELETALGGVYSILSQEFQLPLINILLESLVKQGKMPRLPKESIRPTVVTGIEALGRGQDLNKLATFLQYLQPLGQEVIASELNIADYIDRLAASLGIDTSGLIKSPEQKQQEQMQQQQMQQQQMLEQTAAGMAQGAAPQLAKGAVESEG